MLSGINVDFKWEVELSEHEVTKLSKGEKVDANPSIKLIEKSSGNELNAVLEVDDKGYVSLKKSQDLDLLELKVGLIQEVEGDSKKIVGSAYDHIGIFNCDSNEVLSNLKGEENYYIWTTDKIDRGAILLKNDGTMKIAISLTECQAVGRTEEATCDLKVVT